jgi:PAS domain S-box-containing protein
MATAPIRVLAVDDRADNLMAIEVALRSPEYEIVKAGSGEEALRFLLHNDCALILMDVQMPGMDGFETARLIRQSPRASETPIIFLTAVSKGKNFAARGYADGAVDYLLKPFDPDVLRAKVGVFATLYRSKLRILRQAELLREHEASERRRTLAELELRALRREQALQQRYRDLVNGISHAIIWAADPLSLVASFVSPSAEEIVQSAPEEWGRPNFWNERLHPEESDRVMRLLRQVGLRGGHTVFEHRFARRDGTYAWLQTSARLVETPDGLRELHGLSIDLTAQKHAEEALRLVASASSELAASLEQDEALRRFFPLLVPKLADWCVAELVEDTSQGVQLRSFGHAAPDRAELVARLCQFHPTIPLGPEAQRLDRALLYSELDSESFQDAEATAAHLECLMDLAPRACLAVPLTGRGRRLGTLTLGLSRAETRFDPSVVMIAEELGRRVAQAIDNARLFSEVQESVRLREDFLSVASHELKTPLTPLKLQLDALTRLLAKEEIPREPREEAARKLSTTQRHIERLSRLVESLLDVSRIRTGRIELQLEEVDLGTVVSDVLGRYREELARDGIDLSVDVDEPLVGQWDRIRLDQVVTNLVTNAIKYGEKKPILVTAKDGGARVVLTVEDHGIGISGPNPDRVFRRFERAVDARSYGGLGLGLYIVRQLVELHRGTVSVQTREGVGSTFIVDLPKGMDRSLPAFEPVSEEHSNGSVKSGALAEPEPEEPDVGPVVETASSRFRCPAA